MRIHPSYPGREEEQQICDRINSLTEVLLLLGVEKNVAADAWRIKYTIGEHSFRPIKNHRKEHMKLN